MLFDLDGTLLDIDLDAFWDAYMRSLSEAVARIVDPETFLSALTASTKVMLADTDRARTNSEVFWDDFLARTGLDPAVLHPVVDRFYEVGFARLAGFGRPTPLARDAVISALSRGVPVAIATNPIMPRRGVDHRLEWARVDDLDFSLVTTYEVMHACKPHLDYYAEIADTLGVRPEDCLMVGNDEDDDMVAGDLGMRTFLVDDHAVGPGVRPVTARGSMADLLEYLNTPARPKPPQPDRAIPRIAARISAARDRGAVLDALLDGALQLAGGDVGSVMLLDPDANTLFVARSEGLPERFRSHSVTGKGEGIAAWVAHTCEGLVINDVDSPGPRRSRRRTRSAVCVPIQGADGRCYGVVNVGSSRGPGLFSDVDVERLTAVAGLAAAALSRFDNAG